MATILVEVSGGLARVAIKRKRTQVEIVDLDQLRGGAYEDSRRYWKDWLSPQARKHVRDNHPELARHLDS